MYAAVEKAVRGLARLLALLGGLVLVAVTVLTVISITGRSLVWAGLSPVPGDYELVEMGSAFAVFAFLPWCQMERGHVTVDLFLAGAGDAVNRTIDLISDLLLTSVAGLICWRLFAGLQDKAAYNETTFILQIPLWLGYSAAMIGATVFVIVSAFSIWRSAHGLTQALSAGTVRAGEGK